MSAMTSSIQKIMYDPGKYGKTNKKNFIQENMRHLKKNQNGQNNKKKVNRRGGGDEKYVSSRGGFKYGVPSTPQTEVELRTYKEKGCQTVPDSKLAYSEGVILYPTEKPKTPPPRSGRRNAALQTPSYHCHPVNASASSPLTPSSPNSSLIMPRKIPIKEDGKIDYVKLNAFMQFKKKSLGEKRDPTKAPPYYQRGVVPRYLREAKKVQLEEMKEKGIAEEMEGNHPCPPGHVLLTEEEKKEHLKKIRIAYADYVSQLNLLPLKSDSLKIKLKREQLEKDLQRLEEGIKLFSREKLYVKID